MSSGTTRSNPDGSDPLATGPSETQDQAGKGSSGAAAGNPYTAGEKAGGQAGPAPSGTSGIRPIPAGIPGVTFELDGEPVEARPGETIWEVAKRLGTTIPHLCHRPEPGYRPDGNCRACMVEIEGERVLAASCKRTPMIGMKVKTASPRAASARALVMELLVADQPARDASPDPDSAFWAQADAVGVTESRFPAVERWSTDASHPAMRVNLDACIQCGLCVRGCREVQVNDVIGMAFRNAGAKVVFDFDDPMGESTCVACGECVQACPTGALMPAAYLDENQVRTVYPDRQVDSLCPYCGVGCQVTYNVKDERIVYAEGRDGPANRNRLCVKGRFGFDYIHHPHRLTKPLIRLSNAAKDAHDQVDPANPWTHFREASWEEALAAAGLGLARIKDVHGPKALAGFGSAKGSNEEAYLFQKLVRTGFGSNNVDHCTRLCHASSVAALMEGLNSGAVTAPFSAALDAEVIVVIGANPAVNHPVAATFIKNAVKDRGAKLVVMDPRRQQLSRHAYRHLAFKPGADVAMLNAMLHTIIEEGLTDAQYIAGYTENFEALRESIREFSPEAMAPVCGIPAETLREVARAYARSRASSSSGAWACRSTCTAPTMRAASSHWPSSRARSAAPARGCTRCAGKTTCRAHSDAGLIPMVYPDYQSVEREETRKLFEAFWGARLDPKRGLTVVEIMDAIHEGSIRGMYIEGREPGDVRPRPQPRPRGARTPSTTSSVQDLFLTETPSTRRGAPASPSPRRPAPSPTRTGGCSSPRPVIAPPGRGAAGWWIIQEIARALACPGPTPGPADEFAELAQVSPVLKEHHPGSAGARGGGHLPVDSRTGTATRSYSTPSSPPRAGARGSCPPGSCPPTRSRTPSSPWCSPRAGCSSTGTRAP
jgi:formate dehydrogenase major subunit